MKYSEVVFKENDISDFNDFLGYVKEKLESKKDDILEIRKINSGFLDESDLKDLHTANRLICNIEILMEDIKDFKELHAKEGRLANALKSWKDGSNIDDILNECFH